MRTSGETRDSNKFFLKAIQGNWLFLVKRKYLVKYLWSFGAYRLSHYFIQEIIWWNHFICPCEQDNKQNAKFHEEIMNDSEEICLGNLKEYSFLASVQSRSLADTFIRVVMYALENT